MWASIDHQKTSSRLGILWCFPLCIDRGNTCNEETAGQQNSCQDGMENIVSFPHTWTPLHTGLISMGKTENLQHDSMLPNSKGLLQTTHLHYHHANTPNRCLFWPTQVWKSVLLRRSPTNKDEDEVGNIWSDGLATVLRTTNGPYLDGNRGLRSTWQVACQLAPILLIFLLSFPLILPYLLITSFTHNYFLHPSLVHTQNPCFENKHPFRPMLFSYYVGRSLTSSLMVTGYRQYIDVHATSRFEDRFLYWRYCLLYSMQSRFQFLRLCISVFPFGAFHSAAVIHWSMEYHQLLKL